MGERIKTVLNFGSNKIPSALARSLRSCPPRGGPIRSVLYYIKKIKKEVQSRTPNSVTILHAPRSIYTRGSVIFESFLSVRGVPKLYGRYSPIATVITFFATSRQKLIKRDTRVQMAPKVITLLRIRISSFFQRIQQTSRRIRFLPCQKRIKK